MTTSTEPLEQPVPDDDAVDLDSIAESLAVLSCVGRLPSGAADTPRQNVEFQAGDVHFDSNGWIQKLLEVEPWLNVAPLPQNEQGVAVAMQFFQELTGDPTQASACFVLSSDGVVRLSGVGAELLERRLSEAEQHRSAFEDLLEDGASFEEASEHWDDRWKEDHTQARAQIGHINAKVETWKIKAFKGNAEEGKLDLDPSYQRDVVWANSESQKLIESIARGIPLPSVILTHDAGTKRWAIVDGKQRLTAILRFMGYHPFAIRFAESAQGGLALMRTNFRKFATLNKLTPKDFRDHRLPFKFRTVTDPKDPVYSFSSRYYHEIKDLEMVIAGSKTTFEAIFESESSDYLISVIIYKETALQDIHHVFGLYNKQGKKLNAEELRNAVFHHLHLTRLLLVVGGDRGDDDVSRRELAQYLPQHISDRCALVGETLKSHHNFGVARFKRTKVLSWTCAILLHSPSVAGETVITPSTASHIDDMLTTIKERGEEHAMYQVGSLTDLARDLQDCILAHAAQDDAWAPKFKNRKGVNSRWDELPLVGSLLGLLLVNAGEGLSALPDRVESLREITQSMKKLTKSQNRTQWIYIAHAATRIFDAFGLNDAQTSERLKQRYGYSCLPVLRKLATFDY